MAWHYVITDGYNWAPTYGTNQTDNAREIWNTLVNSYHWTENSASAVLGNFQVESFINPGQFEIGYNYDRSRGFGLGQWTPSTKISNYIGSTNFSDMADGAKQLLYLLDTPSQYSTHYLNPDGSSTYYNEMGLPYISSMAEFSQSNSSITDLTKLWAICWERPGAKYYTNSISNRINHASHWYNTFTGSTPEPPTPPTPPPPSDAQSIYYILMKRRRRKFY